MPLKEKVKSKTSTTTTNWFRDCFGKLSGDEGAAILELLLLRREIAQAQVDLIRKRSEVRGLERIERQEVVKILKRGKVA